MKSCPHCHKPLPLMHSAWPTEEEQILREHYPAGGTSAVMERLPHRSRAAIHIQASKLGVRYLSIRPWTTIEIQALRLHYPIGGAAAVQPFMPDRKLHAIDEYARKRRIARPSKQKQGTP